MVAVGSVSAWEAGTGDRGGNSTARSDLDVVIVSEGPDGDEVDEGAQDDAGDLDAVGGVGDATQRGVGGRVGVVEASSGRPYIDSVYSGVLALDICSWASGIYGILGVGGLSIASSQLSGSSWLRLIPV